MNLLFYIPEMGVEGERLIELAEKFKSSYPVDIYHVFRLLNLRFRRPVEKEDITVLFIPNREHLREVLSIIHFLERGRLVVILPDHDPITIAQGHLLRPRYLTFMDRPLNELAAVLEKIGSNSRMDTEGR